MCYEYAVKYGISAPGDMIKPARTANSAEECQGLCEKERKCNFFVYHDKEFKCELIIKKGDATNSDDYVSGPKVCTSDFERKTFESFSKNKSILTIFPLF